ncbi:putative integrase/recombinase y4rC [Lentibacillus kapialis]|uniref:Integrase/recombinase y4rC n=1 Tax=Lentibacillus kapialis TaxID=340214 RepID=A0A917V128_9BACI|nr:site-specific integrase [Lentibacillus kapialis]GGK09589.1 putative integrase/recombinase y4rC [Lentibacillus kapialis]
MKPTDFSYYLTRFLTKYLPGEAGASKNTIASYRDTFILFLRFLGDEKNIPADNLTLNMITKNIVVEYLDWMEEVRRCSTATRNVRLAAIHSFFKYLQYENPDNLLEWQKVLSIPVKKTKKKTINYLTLDGVKLLLKMPNIETMAGSRDLTLLTLMYETGARVQEIIDLTPSMIRFDKPYTIKLIGKGNKARIVPLMEPTIQILKRYMEEQGLLKNSSNLYPLFFNKRKEKLTRAGVNYVLAKYKNLARAENKTLIPEVFTCHCLRHSKAMHLLQAGVNLVYIRDILGHSSVQVTEIYAKTDSKQKREAIEKAYTDVSPSEEPEWQENENLLTWLNSFNK